MTNRSPELVRVDFNRIPTVSTTTDPVVVPHQSHLVLTLLLLLHLTNQMLVSQSPHHQQTWNPQFQVYFRTLISLLFRNSWFQVLFLIQWYLVILLGNTDLLISLNSIYLFITMVGGGGVKTRTCDYCVHTYVHTLSYVWGHLFILCSPLSWIAQAQRLRSHCTFNLSSCGQSASIFS